MTRRAQRERATWLDLERQARRDLAVRVVEDPSSDGALLESARRVLLDSGIMLTLDEVSLVDGELRVELAALLERALRPVARTFAPEPGTPEQVELLNAQATAGPNADPAPAPAPALATPADDRRAAALRELEELRARSRADHGDARVRDASR